ncbi:MAG: OmpA family protein [Bacteroidales bacterium]|nr:OmpA family protein [Bacteroidales bacterium]
MKKLLSLAAACIMAASAMAQERVCPTIKSKDLEKRYADAYELMQSNRELGIKYLVELGKAVPEFYPASHVIGGYYLEKAKDAHIRFQQKLAMENSTTAIQYLRLSHKHCPQYDSSRAAFMLGECYFLNHKYEDSRRYFEEFLGAEACAKSCVSAAKRRLEMINEYFYIISNPIKFDSQILRNVSTKDDEFLPLISHDGSILLYSHRYMKRGGDYQEELMESHLEGVDSLGELFTPGVRMPYPFNTGKTQGGASLTIDNRILYITICSHDNCDIYYSKFQNQEWQPLIKLPNTVNTEYFDGQPSVDPTGNVLYFSSNRPGGYGGYDLYKIQRMHEDSLWSSPINLGPDINTEFDEKTPFIHCDGKTLYFASNGHGGVGGFDVFHAHLRADNTFGKPINAGYPLNSENDEVAHIVSADGKRIYFSAKLLSGEGGWDIYCANLDEKSRPGDVLLIKGKVTDEEGKPVADVDVDLTGLRTYETSHSRTDRKTGEYAVATSVNQDEDYMLTMKKKGYFYNVSFISPDSGNYVPPTIDDVTIEKIKTGVPIQLENVNFGFNSSQLTEHSKAYLHQLSMFLAEYPRYNVKLLGHTDGIGDEDVNQALSERRCKTVYNFLLMSGIDAKRLSYKALGKTSPTATNATDQGRAQNRRVEMILSDGKKK